MVEPIGWSSAKSTHHFRSVIPTVPDVGMQMNLHRNLTKRLQPKEVIAGNLYNVDAARRILHRQRVAIRLYSGSRLNLKGSTPLETSARLHRHHFEQPLIRENTAPEGLHREMSDVYSNVRSDGGGSTLLTEASVYGQFPPLAPSGLRMPTIPSSASGLSRFEADNPRTAHRVVERLSTYDPEKVPESKGYLVKLPKPIVYKKKYTEDEIQGIVRRLTEYDPSNHPPESKGVRVTPSCVSAVPRQSMRKIKKCSAEEVQEIVERLYKFDKTKWPPESKVKIRSFSKSAGTVQTAP